MHLKPFLAVFLAFSMFLSPLSALADDSDVSDPEAVSFESDEVANDTADETADDANDAAVVTDEPANAEDSDESVSADDVLCSGQTQNPAYVGVLPFNPPAIPSVHDSAARGTIAQEFYTSIETAGAYLRQQMVAREASISFRYQGSISYPEAFFLDLFDTALRHTGNPTEGDYLKYTIDSYSWELYSNSGSYEILMDINYFTTAAQEDQVTSKISSVLASLNLEGKTDAQIIRSIYDYITANVRYDYAHLNDPSYLLQYSAYAALCQGTSVCQGYATLLYRMLLTCGISSRVYTGIANGDCHAWNIARLGDQYYYLDATWDEGISPAYYDYFLVGSSRFLFDHQLDDYFTSEYFTNLYLISSTDYSGETAQREITVRFLDADTGNLLSTITTTNSQVDVSELIQGASFTYQFLKNLETESTGEFSNVYALSTTSSGSFITIDPFCDTEVLLKKTYLPQDHPNVMTSGQCGASLFWELSSDGTMWISGTGAMWDFLNDADFYDYHKRPWDDLINEITTVYFEEGITYVGAYAFAFATNLTSVHFAKSITSIGNFSFFFCSSLTSVDLPEHLHSLGQQAFYACDLRTLYIPGEITFYDSEIFSSNENLTSVYFDWNPDFDWGSMMYNTNAFIRFCPQLTDIQVSPYHPVLYVKDNLLYGETALLYYPPYLTQTEYHAPDGITDISCPISNSSLQKLFVPATVEYLDLDNILGYSSATIVYMGTPAEWNQITFSNSNMYSSDPAQNSRITFCSGWLETSSGWEYFENGSPLSTWKKIDGFWYYFGADHIMKTGWQRLDGVWYYLGANGRMASGWLQISGIWYYFGTDGAMKLNWQKVDGTWYYFGSNGHMVTDWQQIGGTWYFFGSNGAMRTGWAKSGSYWYYFGTDGAMRTNWQKVNGTWYYLGSNGRMTEGWKRIDNIWYYFGSDGAMRTNWQKVDGGWYYFGSDGAMRSGWAKIDGIWYYFDPTSSNQMVSSKTMVIDGTSYTFDDHGAWKS